MTVIIHISDTHFGTEVRAVTDALKQSVCNLLPDIIILSGDVTQRARRSQFKAAADFLGSLPAKTKLVVPGNHDIPLFNPFMRFLMPYRNFKKAFGPREATWTSPDLGIACYDATSPYRHTNGKINRNLVTAKVSLLKKQLNPKGVIIACAHQPLVTAWPEDSHETLIDREETARLWSEAGVDLVLSGHVHVPIVTTTHKSFPQISRHIILAGAGTAISHRTRPGAPNSFNVITVNAPGISIDCYVFNSDQARFIPDRPVHFSKGNSGWQIVETL